MNKLPDVDVDLIAIHGQTLYHRPPISWQAINLPLVAHSLDKPVVGDMRAADLTHGGQGAPITPIADRVLYPGDGRRAILNLGGLATPLFWMAIVLSLAWMSACAINS